MIFYISTKLKYEIKNKIKTKVGRIGKLKYEYEIKNKIKTKVGRIGKLK